MLLSSWRRNAPIGSSEIYLGVIARFSSKLRRLFYLWIILNAIQTEYPFSSL